MTTEEEREKIIKYLTELMKDHIYIFAERKARELVRSLFDLDMKEDDKLTITYTFDMNAGLLLTLLGKVRKKDIKKKSKVKEDHK